MDLRTKGARTLYEYWNRLRGRRPMPLATDFDLVEIASILPNTMIHTSQTNGDFQFRFFGPTLVRSIGADLTGLSLTDIMDEIDHEKTVARLTRVIVEPIALITRFETAAIEGGTYETEHLLLPLSNKAGVGMEIVSHATRINGGLDPKTFSVGSFSGQKVIDQEWLPLAQ